VLNPRYASNKDPGFERRFFLEASITSKLKHPNTVTVHDYGRTDEGVYYIAMEYLEGDTLQKLLHEHGRLPWPRALYIVGQIARSLREAHKMGLVHRDLKPANIMVMSEDSAGDTVKVLDFGLVKSFVPDAQHLEDEVALTQAGVLMGSPLYMAPEQTRGEADGRTDIYSLGVVMFQLMAGKPPFYSKESIDIIVKHVKEKPPELKSLVPDIPPDVNALVMRCLQKSPDSRFQSMDQLLDALRAVAFGHELSGAFADPRRTNSLILSSADLRRALASTPKQQASHTWLTFVLGLSLLAGLSTAGVIAAKRWLDNSSPQNAQTPLTPEPSLQPTAAPNLAPSPPAESITPVLKTEPQPPPANAITPAAVKPEPEPSPPPRRKTSTRGARQNSDKTEPAGYKHDPY
jgi:serine/threonine protein kinase